jgi:antagonist of KipI
MTVFEVEAAGLFTTIQDLGRTGQYASGVPLGGAMDRFALTAANLLVGNPAGAAALECTLAGPALVARRGCLVAVTGADLDARRNDQPVPGWTGFFLAPGDRLSFGGRRSGARAYVAVAGGIAGQRWLGSASTYLLVERGGFHGRPLKAGDQLELAADPPIPAVAGRRLLPAHLPPYSDQPELRLVAGPHARKLQRRDHKALLEASWQVSRDADRMGYRLEGPQLEIEIPGLISFGLAPGCVQVPPSGQPIVLMADHQTAGGYPVVGAVARADLPLLAQLLPGNHLRFREVGIEEAQQAWADQQGCLAAV